MKSVSLVLTSLAIAFAFSACGACPKSHKSHGAASGCCASTTKCPPTKDCPAGSATCEKKKAS